MKEIAKYSGCFVCGDQNQHGLKARFYYDGDRAVTEVVADQSFEGYRGIYHGGILAALLDEVMIKAILAQDRFVVTVEMTVRYHTAVRTGDKIRFSGRLIGNKGRLFITEGEAVGDDGKPFATATGKYVEAREDFKAELQKSLD
ncbi:MAG: PaaI family thioesterase [Alphaproteobacteria bacterium]|nr:PaaI family thioesterase [Alphaproteobacteria bacterium]